MDRLGYTHVQIRKKVYLNVTQEMKKEASQQLSFYSPHYLTPNGYQLLLSS